MTKDELISKGWDTWYNDDYWVHPKTVADPTRQDYTYYGMSFEKAVEWERENRQPIPAGRDLGSMFEALKKLDLLRSRLNGQKGGKPNEADPSDLDAQGRSKLLGR